MEDVELRDYQGQRVTQDSQVHLDYKENLVRRVLRVLVGLQDLQDNLALMEKMAFLVPLENVDQLVIRDHQDHLVLLE